MTRSSVVVVFSFVFDRRKNAAAAAAARRVAEPRAGDALVRDVHEPNATVVRSQNEVVRIRRRRQARVPGRRARFREKSFGIVRVGRAVAEETGGARRRCRRRSRDGCKKSARVRRSSSSPGTVAEHVVADEIAELGAAELVQERVRGRGGLAARGCSSGVSVPVPRGERRGERVPGGREGVVVAVVGEHARRVVVVVVVVDFRRRAALLRDQPLVRRPRVVAPRHERRREGQRARALVVVERLEERAALLVLERDARAGGDHGLHVVLTRRGTRAEAVFSRLLGSPLQSVFVTRARSPRRRHRA
mmetsp:Transcript_13642/g.58279  ORF Transcript_13642/g.58279 Transcript_13642/m.58279 type:complete len:305 (+) Transcript_13642:359-1273(+)